MTLEEDAFWAIALEHTSDPRPSSSSESEDEDSDVNWHATTTAYELLGPTIPIWKLHLAPLAQNEGIWSPLGAQAWYGSALLSVILLSRLESMIKVTQKVTALELGSGAVGLSGLALIWRLAHCSCDDNQDTLEQRQHRVILTDNEPRVLKKLQENITMNLARMRRTIPATTILPEVQVRPLDWNESAQQTLPLESQGLDLIFGSELVYTRETANACAAIVSNLLDQHRKAKVVIVQVTDRDGWSNIFVPYLQERFSVTESTIDREIHDAATRMIPHGGTLDRMDFGLLIVTSRL